jgi:hypothetical protein
MAAVAGARRTESAYGRYLQSIRASDAMVNIPTPDTSLIAKVEHLPGVRSAAAYAGIGANPVVHGHVDDSFLTNSINSSIDGQFYREDTLTVLSGRLPRMDSSTEIALSPSIAKLFGVGVGGTVEYQFYDSTSMSQAVVGSASFRVTGLVEAPPALVDQFDEQAGAYLSEAATVRFARSISYSWVGLQLVNGSAGLTSLQSSLTHLSAQVGHGYTFPVRRMDTVHRHVQEAVRPQALALAVFGALAALALLILVGQSLAQWLQNLMESVRILRAFGLKPRDAAVLYALGPAVTLAAGLVLALAGAVALSPLAPLEPVRQLDPVRGVQFDAAVLLGGALVLGVLLIGLLAKMSWRKARLQADAPLPRPSGITRAVAALPNVAATGVRFALEPAPGRRRSAVRANLAGTAVAVVVVVTAAVFGASLDGLVSHPDRYGWDWDVLIQNQAGYGSFLTSASPAAFHGGDGELDRLMDSEHGVAGWSTFGFAQLLIDGQIVPVLGLTTHRGSVEPPTASGRTLDASKPYQLAMSNTDVPDQIELGAATLRQLNKQVGDTVSVGTGGATRRLTVVGIVTLPSIGVGLTDHVSLGTGAMLAESTLLSVEGLHSLNTSPEATIAALPSAVVFDMDRGVRPASVVRSIVDADPGASPGGDYQLPRVLAASIVNASQMSGQPLALALALGVAVLVSLSAAVATSARRRRRELAVLQTLGMTRYQLRGIIACQTLTLLLVAEAVGLPLGIVAGRWAWAGFATSLGVVPTTVLPVASFIVGPVVLLAAGAVLTSLPRFYPAGTSTAESLRTE